jgi:hypothetical protein
MISGATLIAFTDNNSYIALNAEKKFSFYSWLVTIANCEFGGYVVNEYGAVLKIAGSKRTLGRV